MDHLVCTTCLVGLVNDDWTAIEDNHSAVATAEALGMVTHTGSENHGVYRCTVCGDDHYGRAEIVTAA
ncbi:hypothetical protein M3E10_02910 [Dietzia cinnamea]|uniref:Uncharacterized protein n=2 Tax=Dietzia cinnamea TaxID=321318 RepID=A0AAW5Q9H4_9ACTN|nr:hypothetical protein [Dietzia cinnamea]MCT2033604.1 hypothetical protein [Dietzia cinnamea]MCT2108739.1 hypothetical protein [Dietzia cinnamea]MCT2117690.1 hypothetical protein [Dietzia cinnamea]MCT2140912.1 hypothetical protein [Dietzia cinnamea]